MASIPERIHILAFFCSLGDDRGILHFVGLIDRVNNAHGEIYCPESLLVGRRNEVTRNKISIIYIFRVWGKNAYVF